MLGTTLIDAGFESAAGTYAGPGLLDCATHFASYEKNTTQVTREAAAVPPILSGHGNRERVRDTHGRDRTGQLRRGTLR